MTAPKNIKQIVLGLPLAARLNGWNKTRILKAQLRALDQHYGAMDLPARWQDLAHDDLPDDLLSGWQGRLSGKINTLFVGTNQAQDQSGTLQALERASDHFTTFTQADGTYGMHFPRHSQRKTAADNGARLWQIFEELRAAGHAPDLVIGQMQGLNMDGAALQRIRDAGTVIINITMDDRLPHLWQRGPDQSRRGAIHLAPYVDLTLTTCANCVAWYLKEGHAAKFTSLASDPAMSNLSEKRDIPISFVGNKYGIRGEIIQAVIDAGLKVEAYGRGWPNGSVSAKDAAAINGRSQIILGVGTVAHTRDVYTMKLRDFDALMAGAAYVTHRNPDLLSIFAEGRELLCYETTAELITVLRDALQSPERLAEIGAAGAQACLENHTWDKLFADLLDPFRKPRAREQTAGAQ